MDDATWLTIEPLSFEIPIFLRPPFQPASSRSIIPNRTSPMIAFRSLRTQAAVLVGAICLATAAGLGGMASLEIIDVSNQALRMDTETAGEKAAESLKRIGDRINAYAGLAARDGEILD